MTRFSKLLILAAILLATVGCSQNYYNIPRETYDKKVRILGVAPIFVDAESDIRHPEKQTLVALVKDFNRKNEPELVAGLKDTGSYFSVALLPDDSDTLYTKIFFRREKRDDAGIVYNKYFYKGAEIRDLMAKNSVDALLLLVVSGLTTRESIFSSNLLAKLESDYNYLSISGQIIDAEGSVLWEFPNFRKRTLSYPLFLGLQYPDFDEALANETDKVDIKFKTIPGINRKLAISSSSSFRKSASVSKSYSAIFDEMISMLRPPPDYFNWGDKGNPAPPPTQSAPPATTQVTQTAVQSAQATQSPVTTPPVSAPVPLSPVAHQAPLKAITAPPGSPPAETVAAPSIAPAN